MSRARLTASRRVLVQDCDEQEIEVWRARSGSYWWRVVEVQPQLLGDTSTHRVPAAVSRRFYHSFIDCTRSARYACQELQGGLV